jgi:hypothetical protein
MRIRLPVRSDLPLRVMERKKMRSVVRGLFQAMCASSTIRFLLQVFNFFGNGSNLYSSYRF